MRRERPGDQRAAAEQILIGGPGGDEAESEALTAVCEVGVVLARGVGGELRREPRRHVDEAAVATLQIASGSPEYANEVKA